MNIDKHPEKDKLIELCLKNDRRAQKEVYDCLAPTMMAVCRRYLYNKALVTEIMNVGFLKVFTKLNGYQSAGSFEGWVRKIMVNTCIDENKKINHITENFDELSNNELLLHTNEMTLDSDIEYITHMIDQLPHGLKTIFNMIEIEGYTHKESSELLKITESASRSQLSKAKALLRNMIETKKL